MSANRADGSVVHVPDIAQADAATFEHWRARAKEVGHPVLKARYADLYRRSVTLTRGGFP